MVMPKTFFKSLALCMFTYIGRFAIALIIFTASDTHNAMMVVILRF